MWGLPLKIPKENYVDHVPIFFYLPFSLYTFLQALFYAIVDLSGRTLSVSVISQSTDVFLMRLASSKAQMADSLKSDESSSCQSGPVVEVTVADIPTRFVPTEAFLFSLSLIAIQRWLNSG